MTPYASSYAPSAEADLANLYDYIAERASESIARNYINRIQDECESLADTPLRGTIRDEIAPPEAPRSNHAISDVKNALSSAVIQKFRRCRSSTIETEPA
ncbi:MAG TPA: hypothetical protein DHW63_11495 [Hyphomonadaceae bacterium]|nr:hypothetical protein [Hyphomonadaceae bacterium]